MRNDLRNGSAVPVLIFRTAGCTGFLLLIVCLCIWRGSLLKAEADEPETVATMDSQTILCGEEDPGTIVDITVYIDRGSSERITLFSTRLIVGTSGLYQVSVPLPLIGEQIVSVETAEGTEKTCYRRYSRTTAEELSGVYLNIYDFLTEGGSR